MIGKIIGAKKTKLLVCCLMVAWVGLSPGLAQGTDAFYAKAGDHAALYQGRLEPPFPFSVYDSHPYWDDKDFHEGDICYRGQVYRQVRMRLDVLNHRLVVLTPERELAVVPQKEYIDWLELDGHRFILNEDRFCRVEYEGKNVTLLLWRQKEHAKDIERDGRYVKTLSIVDRFLLVTAEGQTTVVKTLNDVVRLYPDYQARLKTYSRSLHLKWHGDEARLYALTACTKMLDESLPQQPALFNGHRQEGNKDYMKHVVLEDELVEALPAFDAYKKGAHLTEDDFEYMESVERTGVSDLETLREYVIDEVEVLASTPKTQTTQLGMEKFRPSQLRNVPLAMGEADVMKLVQTMPGVTSMGEASSGFNVRGGASDQNLVLLGSNTIFNPMHLFGLFSAFNPDVVGETELYKGGIPSRYGGRISSVMNIASRVADKQQMHGTASVGLLTGKGTLEIPLKRDKASLLLGGRTTYSDWMLGLIPKESDYRDGNAGFWDMSATLDVLPDERNRFTMSGYYSHDHFSFTPQDQYGYSNGNASAQWKVRPRSNDNLQLVFDAGYDHYDYRNDDSASVFSAARLSFDINQLFGRVTADCLLSESHRLQTGLHTQYYDLNPGLYEPLGSKSRVSFMQLERDNALETSAFVEDRWEVTSSLLLTGGVRATLFRSFRSGKTHTYVAPEVRLSAGYSLSETTSLKAGFNTMHQFIHKVSNTVIMSPTDTWILSNAAIRPQQGWQASAGWFWLSEDSRYEVSLEGYFKQMRNYLTYRGAAQLVMNPNLERDVLPAMGHAYGLELQLRKHTGKLNGWVSYCYSRTLLRQQEGAEGTLINDGAWFPADYDRPHQVKFVGNYKFTRRYSLSLNADYSTGRPITVPAGLFYSYADGKLVPFYTDRNSYRLPDYFRMDGSFNIEPGHHLTKLTHSWVSIGVYNMTGRRNAYSVYYQAEAYGIQGYQLSIFGCPIPFISYNIKF